MIIVNFNDSEKEDTIVDKDTPEKAEIFLISSPLCGNRKAGDRSIELKKSICLKSYEYIIIRWTPPIQSLSIIF